MSADDIVAWLTAIYDEQERERLDELERGSRIRTIAHPNQQNGQRVAVCDDCNDWAGEGSRDEVERAGVQHVRDKHDYERVLARIAADRQILALYADARDSYDSIRNTFADDDSPRAKVERAGYAQATAALQGVVRLLASAHADRPGYNEQWRP